MANDVLEMRIVEEAVQEALAHYEEHDFDWLASFVPVENIIFEVLKQRGCLTAAGVRRAERVKAFIRSIIDQCETATQMRMGKDQAEKVYRALREHGYLIGNESKEDRNE